MELTPKQQALRLFEEAKNILLITHNDPDGDAVGSLLASKIVFNRLGKKVTMVAPGNLSETLNFLPHFEEIKKEVALKKEVKLLINESSGVIDSVSWRKLNEGQIEVLLSGAQVRPEDVAVINLGFEYDLICILDTATPEMIKQIWQPNADLFYEVPTISIDHHPSNTQFAKVNLVDVTAAATAEVLISIFEALGKSSEIIDASVATCLLTGLMTDTMSFMNANTTPKSLTVAAQLVAAGARQPEIVRKVFKTNSLPTLRVWGRALSYIKEDRENRFIWSSLSRADFVASGADEATAATEGVIDNLLKTAEDVDFVLLIKEKPDGVYGSLRSVSQTFDVSAIARIFGGGGHVQAAGFMIDDKKLQEVEMEIINKIRVFCQNLEHAALSQ